MGFNPLLLINQRVKTRLPMSKKNGLKPVDPLTTYLNVKNFYISHWYRIAVFV